MSHPSDQQLVEAVLDATANLSLRERQRATGLSHATFKRLHGPWKYLQKETRAALIRYLQRTGKLPRPLSADGLSDAERARLLELVEEMGRILRGEG